MHERMHRLYRKEEEFLEDFPDAVSAVRQIIGNEWDPNPSSDDRTRKNQEYFLSRGELHHLIFDSAAIYRRGMSDAVPSIQILLKSSTRTVALRAVVHADGSFTAEKIHDEQTG